MTNVIPMPFQGDLIDYLNLNGREIAWLWRDGEAFVPVRPICEIMGLDWASQHRKLTAPESRSRCTMMVATGADGKRYQMFCIAYPDFLMWLATITISRVREEAREPLRRLKAEIKLVRPAHYHDRLLGESREAVTQLQGFLTDYLAMKPIRVKVRDAVVNGWTWQMLAQNTSYPRKRLIETIRDLMRIGAIDAPPAGTPLEGGDARQMSPALDA